MPKAILLVDDSMLMLATVKAKLDLAGLLIRVEKAEDGVVALAQIAAGLKPDLVITDMNMPNMGGLELVKGIRALPKLRFIPIIALTTESAAAKREEGKKNGVTAWIVKPANTAELLAVIKYVLPGVARVAARA